MNYKTMKSNNSFVLKFAIAFTLVLILMLCNVVVNNTEVEASSRSGQIIMERDSNRVLYQDNANEKMYMASTTKIVTCLVVIENCNMSDIITVSNDTVGVEGSSIYLEVGEKLSVKDLLYGLMLRSGNDCAETLAVHCSGSIEKFAELMNITAKRIGAVNSNFTNPHGLHDDNHYTTAYDLALISCYAMKNDTFREIVSTKSIDIPFTTRNYNRHLVNKNKMLKEFEGSTGIKTGYTKKAGRCLVSSCVRDGMELICVVLNCPPMFERSKELLTNTFSSYKLYNVLDSDNIVGFIFNTKNNKKIAIYIKDDVFLPLTQHEIKNIKIEYDYPNFIDYSVKKDQEIGSVKIYCENNLIFQQKIYTIIGVE
ncbi:MAG: D-alanyl-D-alanine carboxypeptidase [Clostridiales bacterium]|nr:D-alanyl-D-alanine carboxypeptidase [Clostridiales bacterium]